MAEAVTVQGPPKLFPRLIQLLQQLHFHSLSSIQLLSPAYIRRKPHWPTHSLQLTHRGHFVVTMRFLSIAAGLLSTGCSILLCAAEPAKDFKPPQVFKNINLVRNTNLEKGYVRETINVVVQNTDKQPQSDYYVPFPSDVFNHIGGFEVRNKKSPEKGSFPVTAIEVDGDRFVFGDPRMLAGPLLTNGIY